MFLIRLIMFLAIAYLAYRIYLMVRPTDGTAENPARLKGEAMVRCAWCKVHVPQHLALEHEHQWYCNQEHQRLHQDDGGREP